METTLWRRCALVALVAAFGTTILGLGADPALAAYTAQVQAGTLTITGDGASDKLALRLASGSPTTLEVDVGADGTADFSFDRNTFTAIDVEAGGGDDEVRIDQSGGPFTDETVTMNGGSGNDTLLGGDGADILLGGGGDDLVDGNRGTDQAFLGTGNDRFQWDPGDGSDLVEGQGGHDQLDFNGSNAAEQIEISANGPRTLFTRNVAAITMDLAGIDTINVRALGGADQITVNDLTGTDTKTINLDLAATDGNGDNTPDTIITNGTDAADKLTLSNADGQLVVGGLAAKTAVSGGDPALDTLLVRGLEGDDTLTTTSEITATTQATFDGGNGQDTSRFNGSKGDDQITVALNGTSEAASAPGSALLNTLPTVESLIVSGLDGNDTLSAGNGLSTLTPLTLDGGSGNDTLLGGDGADILLGGGGDDLVDGNRGTDQAFLGTGNDRFQWDPGDGSDLVEGQGGHDQLDFNGSNAAEQIEISANGPRTLFTRNVAAITMDLAGIDTINVRALGGADQITVNDLTGTDTKTINLDLAATDGNGDNTPDTIITNGTDAADKLTLSNADGQLVVGGLAAKTAVSGGDPALDTLLVRGLEGDDTLTTTSEITATTQATFDGGNGQDTSRFNGSKGDDQITVALNGTSEAASAPGSALLNTLPTVESLIVSGLDGNDTLSAGNGLSTLTPLTLDGGSGNDTLLGGDGADILLGGGGDDLVDGNRGTDQAFLGTGNDRFQWDPGDGSDLVEGQGGHDQLDFNGSNAAEQIEISANGPRTLFTRNVAAITMDLAGIDTINVRALGGADQITVNDLTGTDTKTINLDLAATDGNGDNTPDTIITNGTDAADKLTLSNADGQLVVGGLAAKTAVGGGDPALDTLLVRGLEGDDTLTTTSEITATTQATFDGGNGQDTSRFNGSKGDDQITVALNGTSEAASAPGSALLNTLPTVESLIVSGLDGNDTLSAGNGLSTLTPLTLDGGSGNDTLLGGDGADILLGGGGDDLVDGNRGTDQAFLGTGNDRFQWDPGDGSDLVEGQGGHDQLDFNGSNAAEQIEISANGPRTLFTRNVAAITMDLAGIDTINVRALGGADQITVNDLTGTDTKTINLDLAATDGNGDNTPDTIITNGTDKRDVVHVTRSGGQVSVTGLAAKTQIVGSEPTLDTVLVRTLGGNDDVTVAPDVSTLIDPIVDLGADE